MKVFLIGFMGSGKSYVGRRLAEKMEVPYIDLDKQIEEKTGRTITSLFEDLGEDGFRLLESTELKMLGALPVALVSCGGGTPCFFDNIEWMNANGVTIYLKPSNALLFERLARKRAHRPLISHLDDRQLEAFIHQKLAQREPFYTRATHTIAFDENCEDAIIEQLAGFFSNS